MGPVIDTAAGPRDVADARMLFEEYVQWLGVDLCFQGCAALRPFEGDTGEVKRLYVRPAFRGTGLGATLAARVVEAAREAGYRRLVLDTLGHMQSAIGLYRRLGFTEIPPYYNNPIPGAIYFELRFELRIR